MTAIQSFALEEAYRGQFAPGMVDLSSSSPRALAVRGLFEEAGLEITNILDAPLDYEPGGGSTVLRAAIASLYDNISAEDVLVTAGASEAIRVVCEASIGPGDCVVAQRPMYEALRVAPLVRGAHVHDWLPAAGFHFGTQELPADCGNTSAIIYNNPHGPSGSIVGGSYHGGARLIADEVYRPVALVNGHRLASAVDRSDTAVSIGDLSKPLGLGGLRIGWIASRDRALMRDCARTLDFHSGSVSTLSARVALAAISRFDLHLERHLTRARRNLRSLTVLVQQHDARLDWSPPQAGYTAFLRVRCDEALAALLTRMRSRGVFLLDGSVFESPGFVRIGFGIKSEAFDRALEVLDQELLAIQPIRRSPTPDGDVIVLAKAPNTGTAKTRLAADIGAERAAVLCAAFVRDTVDLVAGHARRMYIAVSPADATDAFRELTPDARCFAQPEADFGLRLLHAFETAISDGARHPVLIGTDSPTLPSHLLTVAHQALTTHDVVLGPADDGGYYLIGMNTPQRALFEGIDWSTDRVMSQTLQRTRASGLSVFTLPAWYDIDNGRDLERLTGHPLIRAHTSAALKLHRPKEAVV